MGNLLTDIIKEHSGQVVIIAGSIITAVVGYFGVGKYRRKSEKESIEMESESKIRIQLLKVNEELSKVFDMHLEASKKHHTARIENVRLNSLIQSIKTNCDSDCLTSLLHAIDNKKVVDINEK